MTITGENDAPLALHDVRSTDENAQITVDVLQNDIDPDASAILTLDSVGITSGNGMVSIVNNELVYNPAGYDYLNEGDTAQVEIEYTMSDEHGEVSTATATITITGSNDAPTAQVAEIGAIEGGDVVSGTISPDDVDGNITSVEVTPGEDTPAGFTINNDGTFAFDPTHPAYDHLAEGEVEVITVPVTVTDNNGATTTTTVEITLTGTNDAPTAQADVAQTVDEDTSVIIDVLANDHDIDSSDTISIKEFDNEVTYDFGNGAVVIGTVTQTVDGKLEFTPNNELNQL
jgi:VCBS repeat-containing protein